MNDIPKAPLPAPRSSEITFAALATALDQWIKLAGLAYGIGFVVIMTHTGRLNAPVVEALQFQNIVAGFPVWILVCLVLWLWRDYSEKLRDREELPARSIRAGITVFLISIAIIILIVILTMRAFSAGSPPVSLIILVASGMIFLFAMYMAIQVSREKKIRDPRVRPLFELISIWSGAVFLTISYALFLFPIMPQSWGGGHPARVSLLLKDPETAAQLNAPMPKSAGTEHTATVELYYRSSSYLLVSNFEDHLVHVPMEQVRSIIWLESTSR